MYATINAVLARAIVEILYGKATALRVDVYNQGECFAVDVWFVRAETRNKARDVLRAGIPCLEYVCDDRNGSQYVCRFRCAFADMTVGPCAR